MTNEDLKRFYPNNPNADYGHDFARYDENGRLHTEAPHDNHDAANKAYVDNAVAAAKAGEAGDYENVHNFTEIRSINHIEDKGVTVVYDNDGKILVPIEGSEHVIVDVDETGKVIAIRLDADVTNKLQQLDSMNLHNLTLVETDGYYSSSIAVPENKHIHVLFEVETSGTHAGADFVLHPYNTAVCNVCFSLLVGGKYVNGFAYIDEQHTVRISLTNVDESIIAVIAHYRIL